jgi:HEAT repeat protein
MCYAPSTSFEGYAMTTPEVERLIERLSDKDPHVRRSAAEALGNLGPQAQYAVRPLAKALRDENKHVVFDAAFALGRIGTASVPELIEALT